MSRNVSTLLNIQKCVVCKMLTEDELGWVQCDLCDSWLHAACIPDNHDYDKKA